MSFETSADFALRDLIADQAENILGSILNSVDYGVLLTDLGHLSLACNQQFGRLFMIPIRDVVANDPGGVREMVKLRIKDYESWARGQDELYGDPMCVQDDILWLKNPTAVLRRHTAPVLDASGNPVARLWTFQDCTAEYRLSAMRDCLHETSTVFDPDPRIIYELITRRVAEFYDAVSVLSIRVEDYMDFRAIYGLPEGIHAEGNPISESYCQFCLQQDAPLIIQDSRRYPGAENLLPTQAGYTRYAGVPLRDPENKLIGTFCIMDGRSDEPLDDEDLRFLSLCAMRISGELERERQIAMLSQDLEDTQSRLLRSEKLAVTGIVAASVAHDIRNILSAISLTLSMADGPPEQTLGEVKSHLDQFQILSHRLLSYARPKRVVREEVALCEVLDRVVQLLKGHTKVSRVSVDVDVPCDLPTVTAEASYLDHLFINLLLNGIQASKPGTTISVVAFEEAAQVRVTVRDQGSGISPEVLDTLFEPFSSKRSNGLGLGLYSCRQIVRDCGGKLSVSSQVGEGTTFEIELPRASVLAEKVQSS